MSLRSRWRRRPAGGFLHRALVSQNRPRDTGATRNLATHVSSDSSNPGPRINREKNHEVCQNCFWDRGDLRPAGACPDVFSGNKIGKQTPPEITHPEYFYGFIGVALAWQFAFLTISTDPGKYRAMILPSIVEKITFGIAVLILLAQGRVAMSTVGFASIDWILAVLFTGSYFKTRRA